MGDRSSESKRIERLHTAMARSRGTASSSDGAVTVAVGANGVLHAIELGDGSARLSVRQLADVVVELHKIAFARAGAAVREAIENLGDDEDDTAASESDTDRESGDDSDGFQRSSRDESSPEESPPDIAPPVSDGYDVDPTASRRDNPDSPTESAAAHDMSLGHVIEPFDTPDDDDDIYFTATAEPVRPRRVPRSPDAVHGAVRARSRIPPVAGDFPHGENQEPVERPPVPTSDAPLVASLREQRGGVRSRHRFPSITARPEPYDHIGHVLCCLRCGCGSRVRSARAVTPLVGRTDRPPAVRARRLVRLLRDSQTARISEGAKYVAGQGYAAVGDATLRLRCGDEE